MLLARPLPASHGRGHVTPDGSKDRLFCASSSVNPCEEVREVRRLCHKSWQTKQLLAPVCVDRARKPLAPGCADGPGLCRPRCPLRNPGIFRPRVGLCWPGTGEETGLLQSVKDEASQAPGPAFPSSYLEFACPPWLKGSTAQPEHVHKHVQACV